MRSLSGIVKGRGYILTKIVRRSHMNRDITESDETFRTIVEASHSGIIIGDDRGVITFANRRMADMLGCRIEELAGSNYQDHIHPDDLRESENTLQAILTGRVATVESEHHYVRKDGTSFWGYLSAGRVDTKSGNLKGLVGIISDITGRKHAEEERLKLEQQTLYAQKVESLGVLAGGLAHDFNNILMAIIGNADLALMRISTESPAVENLHRIEQAAARAADLAKQMLAYSGEGKNVVENIDLNLLLEEMLHMLETSISKKAVLRLNQHQPLPLVEADASQLRQVIMNLVTNASEAIGDNNGTIAITTDCMNCDRDDLKDVWLGENLSDGLYVYLEIADTGCGMYKETMAKLFDPFYTTKFTGRGLGMAAVLGIVKGHNGAIKVFSEPGTGTTFTIMLPATGHPERLYSGDSAIDALQGNGTVLLVDDEEMIRIIGTEMLTGLGFKVITAEDGREAIEIFKSRNDIVFVILDLTMPNMDGVQCFQELRQLDPGVKVIISSGYNKQDVAQKFIGKGMAGFLQKPYRLPALKKAIRKIQD
jgi:two-component system, cell cycle sensor histidine kinase and response regulator CckA